MSLTQGLQLPFGIQPVNPTPVDSWSGPFSAADAVTAVADANAAIPSAIRYQSMEVRLIVGGVSKKYWYRDGIADSDLVEFTCASSGGGGGGGGGVLTELVLNETPGGVINGANKIFTLANTPAEPSSVMLWLNGQLQTQGALNDYSVTGTTITINADPPFSGDVLLAMYIRQATVKSFSLNESASFAVISGSLGLEVAYTPSPSTSLMLFRNGQLLTQGSDYTLAGRNITISNNAIEIDDIFLATYSYTA
jgi:hypothetical protein